jgi:cell division septation protein DedD
VAQDDYYYEIQLTNKQLVFYFMAGATGLILSFLAGVMVGKGVDASAGDVQAAKPAPVEERVVAEEPPRATAAPPVDELTYAQRLEGDKPEDASLERKGKSPTSEAGAGAAASKEAKPSPPSTAKATPSPKVSASPRPSPSATPSAAAVVADAGPAATLPAVPAPKPAAKAVAPGKSIPPPSFTIQVGAFKDKATADALVTKLKAKGYAAYAMTPDGPDGGLFNVRVGSYPARADAERVQAKLRDQEKYKPYIVPPTSPAHSPQ